MGGKEENQLLKCLPSIFSCGQIQTRVVSFYREEACSIFLLLRENCSLSRAACKLPCACPEWVENFTGHPCISCVWSGLLDPVVTTVNPKTVTDRSFHQQRSEIQEELQAIRLRLLAAFMSAPRLEYQTSWPQVKGSAPPILYIDYCIICSPLLLCNWVSEQKHN